MKSFSIIYRVGGSVSTDTVEAFSRLDAISDIKAGDHSVVIIDVCMA